MEAIERLLLELETGSDDDRSVAHACRVELDAERAEHERFVADVLHIRGEIEYLDGECKAMREALEKILECRQPQCEMCLKRARAALSMPRVNRAALAPKETK